MKNKIYIHFSIDDVFKSLIEVTDKKMPLKNIGFFHKFINCGKNIILELDYIYSIKEKLTEKIDI